MTLQTHTTVISWLQDDGWTGARRGGPRGPFTRAAQTPPTRAARCWRGLEGDAFRSHRKPQGVRQTKKVSTGFVMQPLKSNLRTSRGEQTLLSTDCELPFGETRTRGSFVLHERSTDTRLRRQSGARTAATRNTENTAVPATERRAVSASFVANLNLFTLISSKYSRCKLGHNKKEVVKKISAIIRS